VGWSSSDDDVLKTTFSNALGLEGLQTGLLLGTANVAAVLDGVTDTDTGTVSVTLS